MILDYATITTMKPATTVEERSKLFEGMIDEIKKVTWPSRAETIRLTLVVIAISIIIGIYIGVLDLGFAKILELLTKPR
jgi:preprotein translocase subunit SecE